MGVPNARLSSTERRTAIIEAVLPLFAKKGFHGVTTRELADAAGVSEALLFRHFPSKASLYKEIRTLCETTQAPLFLLERITIIPPSTEKLILLTYLLVRRLGAGGNSSFHRLLLSSLLEDGNLTRTFLKNHMGPWLEMFAESLEAGRKAGEIEDTRLPDSMGLWFSHHLAVALMSIRLPGRCAVDYGIGQDELILQAARFCLRGMGVKESILRAPFDPVILAAVEQDIALSDW